MVTKILRLSQITNGGPGSGESEGHEFRGNQYDGVSIEQWGSEEGKTYKAYRGGNINVDDTRGIFVAPDEKSARQYLEEGQTLHEIEVTVDKPIYAKFQPSLYQKFFGKDWQDAKTRLDAKTHSDSKSNAILDARIAKAAFKAGYRTIIYTEPWAPAKKEIVVLDPRKSLKIVKSSSERKNILNLSIEDSIGSIVKQYLESNVDSTLSTVSSSHIIGALTAKGNLQENPMVSFDLLRQQSLDYAMEHTKEIIEKGGSTIQGKFKPWLSDADNELRSSISTVITDGINKGKSRDEIKRDLKAVYDADDVRIDRIAGWEIPDAQYQGAFQQYDEDGVTIFEWLLGDSPCEVCEPYGEKRFFTADELPDSLLHPGCQCDIAPVVSDQLTSMVKRLINGGEGSGEHEGHEFRGNQWGDSVVSAKESLKFERGSSAIFSSKMSNEEMRDRWDSISNIKGRNIDDDEIDALRGYQQSEYSNMNEVARTGEVKGYPNITDSIYNMNASMDLAIEHGSQTVPEGVELWRGIGEKHGASVADMEIGDICKDDGFQSFSIDPYVGGNFARAFVTPGSTTTIGKSLQTGNEEGLGKTVIRAISTGTNEKALGGSMTERELIFPRGTSWQVVSKEQFDIGRGIKLNVVTVVHHG